MAKGAGAAMAVAVVAGTMAVARPAFAEPTQAGTVVLHVTDYAGTAPAELADAQERVTRFYARIGVRLAWTDGSAQLAARDGALHLDVWILSDEMVERKGVSTGSFGDASRVARRAYLYHPRMVAHARRTGGAAERVLALVLAHEIGHMLLPEHSHAGSGLMRAHWAGRIVDIPDFMPEQVQTIRTLMAAADN
jgi:hypothetical protein